MIDNRKIAVVAYVPPKAVWSKFGIGGRVGVVLENEWVIPKRRTGPISIWLRWWVYVVLAGAGGWLAMTTSAWATHEVNHRFEVTGTVRAADGTPRPNLKVVVSHPRDNLSESALTDSGGRYTVLLHLHDKDAGDPVTVTAGDETITVRADYNPSDHRTRRIVTVDFGPHTEVPDDQSRIWWYGLGGAAVAGGALYWRLRAKRSRRTKPTGRKKKSNA